MSHILHDCRYAVRGLRKRPGFSIAVITTMMMAIGATTAVFSVVNGVLLKPLAIPDPEQVVRIWEVDQRPGFFDDRNLVAVANFGDWRDQNRVFSSIAAFQQYPVTLRSEGDPRPIMAAFVTHDFLQVLGVGTSVGRTFLAEDDVPDAQTVVILSHRLWNQEFGADPGILQRNIGIGSNVYPIVGVLSPAFDRLDLGIDVLAPIALRPGQFANRRSHLLSIIARTKPDISIEAAQRDMDRIVDGLRPLHPEFLQGWGVNVRSLTDAIIGDVRPALLVLQAGVIVLLLIATVNLANIMLARTVAERRDLAIRTALGASRGRLILQRLVESTMLAAIGGGLGVMVAHFGVEALLALAPGDLPMVDQVQISWQVVGFAVLATGFAALGFGLIPALPSGARNISRSLGARGVSVEPQHHRIRAALVVTQLAFALTLLISAGLLVKTFVRLMQVDPGFQPSGTATARLTLPSRAYSNSVEQAAFYDRLLADVRALPSVTAASATRFLPLVDDPWTWSVQIEGQPAPIDGEKRDYGRHAVMPGYFETMGIALRAGRPINQFDRHDSPPVAVVNEAFVRRFLSDGANAVGRRMMVMGEGAWIEIVGVVEDVHQEGLDIAPQPAYYAPLTQVPDEFRFGIHMNLVVRSAGNPGALLGPIRAVVRATDPDVVMSEASTMVDHVSASTARARFAMTLLSAFALIAAALAIVGVYGVVSYSVGQRIPEIGVRLALGARRPAILGDVVWRAVRLALGGVTVGIVTAVFVTRFQASMLFGVTAHDPTTYAILAIALVTVAALAAFFPAYRASRTDPMRILREE